MNSSFTERFWHCFNALPIAVREVAQKNYNLWRQDSRHPSLHFKAIRGNVWSIRAGILYRALGLLEDDSITWFCIGSHAEYDALIRGT